MDDDGLISRDQFIVLEKRRNRRKDAYEAMDIPGDGYKRHVPRRWAVRIWNLQIESLIKDEGMVFININWGGDREEARIRTGEGDKWWQILSDSEVVWGMGSDPQCIRTDVMVLTEKGQIEFENEFSFEWRGSYDELETQNMVVELWRWNKYRANTLDSVHKASLVSYATGPVFQDISLCKATTANVDASVVMDDKESLPRFEARFQLYFQELYDFELNVIDLQAFGLMSETELRKSRPSDFTKITKMYASGTSRQDDDKVQSIWDMSESSEDSDDEKVTARKRRRSTRRSGTAGVQAFQRTATRRLSVENRGGELMVVPNPKLKRRAVINIKNPSLLHKLRRGRMEIRSDMRKTDNNTHIDRWGNIGKLYYRGTLADLDNDLLYLHFYETTPLAPVPTTIAEATVSLRGVHEYGNISGACSPPDWVITNAAKTKKYTAEEIKMIKKSTIGRFEAKIAVENLPKYKQSGELCDMINDKAYLLVKILRVDRVAIPDQRPISQCDSAVQVQFSGNSYETEVRQDTVSPQFNQEFYFELKTDSPSEFSPDELAIMHGPIIFDVWLRSDDEGALTAEHCGHVEISLLEIFQEGKAEIKLHNSIRTGHVTEYRTAVLKARRRLTCLWSTFEGSRAPSNVPASALAPSYLYVDVWLRPFDFNAFSLQSRIGGVGQQPLPKLGGASQIIDSTNSHQAGKDPLLPPRVKAEWVTRSRIWGTKADRLRDRYKGLGVRFFEFTARSQNRDEHFVSSFLDIIRPPEYISNARAVAYWIHCVSHTAMEDLKAAMSFWATPDFTLSLGKGDTFAHAILHCSMIRGIPGNLNARPFVCVGTGWDGQPVAWQMTMQQDGSVTFWDTAGHQTFVLPNRFADADRCRRVVHQKRAAAQCVTQDFVELELKRRSRLVRQEAELQKMKKVQQETYKCDPFIMRSPELLKLMDAETHQHALVYSTSITPTCWCYRCGQPPTVLQGYVCNMRIMKGGRYSQGDTACLTDDGSYLCLKCADRLFKDEPPLPTDENGDLSIESLPPAKFAEQPIMPYKTIDIVFDATNCWMNLQHFCPSSIYYDLWNPLYWHPFTSVITLFRSFSLASKGLRKAKPRDYFENIKARVSNKLKKSIESVRRNGNLSTYIQREPLLMEHVEKGLELIFKRELIDDIDQHGYITTDAATMDAAIRDWRLELYAKVPQNHKFIGHTFLFSFTDAIEISRIVLDKINFLALKEVGTQFVVASYIGKLPNSVKAAYVYIGIVFPLTESTARQVTEIRNADSFQSNATVSAFSDEVIERNRLFVQRMQVFENDTDFISKMRGDLYNKEIKGATGRAAAGTSNVVQINKGNPTKAPFSVSEPVVSSVDYVVGSSPDLIDPEDENAQLLAAEQAEGDYSGAELGADSGKNLGGRFANLFNPLGAVSSAKPLIPYDTSDVTQQVAEAPGTGSASPLDVISSGAAAGIATTVASGAASYFSNLFGGSSAAASTGKPVESAPLLLPTKNTKRAPRVKDLSKRGIVTSPLDQTASIDPTEEELREIYKPKSVERVISTKQFLHHVPTGYNIPVPPQEPMRKVLQLGGEDLTTSIKVTSAEVRNVVRRIDPPKEAVYAFKMQSQLNSPKK